RWRAARPSDRRPDARSPRRRAAPARSTRRPATPTPSPTRRAGPLSLRRATSKKGESMDWNRRGRSLAAGLAAFLAPGPAAAQTSGLKIQYKIPSVAVNDNHVRPHLQVVNTGTATVALSELTIRYWYTVDGDRPQVYVCDYTPRGCGNVTSQFVV